MCCLLKIFFCHLVRLAIAMANAIAMHLCNILPLCFLISPLDLNTRKSCPIATIKTRIQYLTH